MFLSLLSFPSPALLLPLYHPPPPAVDFKPLKLLPSQADSPPAKRAKKKASTEPEASPKVTPFKLLSWNTGGIDEPDAVSRAEEIASIVMEENPDGIMLQEVTPETDIMFRGRFKANGYAVYDGGRGTGPYYTMTAVREGHGIEHEVIGYDAGSDMGRNLSQVSVDAGGRKVVLLNTHLESGAAAARTRVEQAEQALALLISYPTDSSALAIFGGDTNLRETEVTKKPLKQLIAQVSDAWLAGCGASDKSNKYTWDLNRNHNAIKYMGFQGNPGIKARYDRIFFHSASKACEAFTLLGTEPMAEGYYPSDHFGICCTLK
ncbi:unnamed protein product [Chrysoparadoxa australica]